MSDWSALRCPTTGEPLLRLDRAEAEQTVFRGRRLRSSHAARYAPIGPSDVVLARRDGTGAYPVLHEIPILLAPELLVPDGTHHSVDVSDDRYAEAYEEMRYYDDEGERRAAEVASTTAAADLARIRDAGAEVAHTFPRPGGLWLDAKYELAAQAEAYEHLRPLADARALQLGGSGLHAVKFLLAGASEAWMVSPMVGELLFARALAEHVGVAERLRCVAAIAEELPFVDGYLDAVYSQGCVHHWVTDLALPECHRVLRPGGRFAAVEPWRAPFYGIGTKLLGKRQREVHCVVLTAPRVAPQLAVFGQRRIVHHGALTRYLLLALAKLRIRPSRRVVWRIGRIDDALADRLPGVRRTGSSVAILATRAGSTVDAPVAEVV